MHFFDTENAKMYGVNAAIILQNLIFWTEKKQANGQVADDGLVYIYNSIQAWNELFPYMTPHSIRTALKKLEDAKVITSRSDLNKLGYDRTKHYAVSFVEKRKWSCRKTQMDVSKNANAFSEKRKPIPDINTDRDTDINTDIIYSDESLNVRAVQPVSPTGKSVAATKPKKPKNKITASDLILEFGVSEQIANEYLVVRGKAPLTPTALKLILNEADKIGWSLQQALTACCENSWRGFRADWIKNQQLRLGSQNNEGFKTAQASIDRLSDTSWAK